MALPASSRSVILLLLLLLIAPVPAAAFNSSLPNATSPVTVQNSQETVHLFIPTGNMIHSDQINDQINGFNGEVIFGTSFGLSTYNGTWSTRHRDRNNISQGLMDDYITAIEFDNQGRLWIGYSGGIQIYNGNYYESIRDQQLLKETRITDLQRWDNDMWIATGHAGIHRFRDGNWTWFQPMTNGGPGFYEIHSMALDPAGGHLLLATDHEGLWIVRSPDDPVRFELISGRDAAYGLMQQVRRDPLGGVYFFNNSMVVHYDNVTGFAPRLTNGDLSANEISINDLDAAPDGRIYLATDDGIYIWGDGTIIRHLTRYDGIGTAPAVRTVRLDGEGRAWFSTRGYVGYFRESRETDAGIGIDMATNPVVTTPEITATATPEPGRPAVLPQTTAIQPSFFPPDSFLHIFNPIVDPLARALRGLNITPGQ
jgi:ligand-binding sensor domain-containing protein